MTLPAPAEKRRFVEQMFDRIAPRYDLLNRLMTFGVDLRWRHRTIAAAGVRPGSLVLDLACGTGDLARDATAAGARVVGVDSAAQMLRRAQRRGGAGTLVRADGLALPLPDATFDAVVCGFALRNFAAQAETLAECGRVLRPGATLAILEIDVPTSAPLRLAFDTHLRRVVPLLGRLLVDAPAYAYLSASLAYLPSASDLVAMLEGAGFDSVGKISLSGGLAQMVTAVRSDERA